MTVIDSGKVQAVLFDLGETLLTFGRLDTSYYFKLGAELTYNYLKQSEQPVGNFRVYRFRNLFAIRWQYFLSSISGNDFDALDLLKKIGLRRGYRLSDAQWDQLCWLWYEPLSTQGKVEPDIKETLGRLRDMNLKLGVLSNTFINSSSLNRQLSKLGMLEYFDEIMYSYEFNSRKPNEKIFIEASEKIGFAPVNIAFVGDRIDKDIQPALKLGMMAVLKDAYTNAGRRTPVGAHRIEAISQLPKIVESINRS